MTVFLNKFFYLVNFLTELNFISTVIVTNSQSDQENKRAAEKSFSANNHRLLRLYRAITIITILSPVIT